MTNKIDLWSIESSLYAYIDANGMRSSYTYKKSFELGNDHFVDIKITNISKSRLSNHSKVSAKTFVISLNFRKKGNKQPWFRVDNESRNYEESNNCLHFHLELDEKRFQEHQKIDGQYTVADVISMTFDSTYRVIAEKFPDEIILDGQGFVGTA